MIGEAGQGIGDREPAPRALEILARRPTMSRPANVRRDDSRRRFISASDSTGVARANGP